jgi:hypothetical protein
MLVSARARAWIGLVCAVLLLPVVGLRFQTEASLERFHNRTLNKWPATAEFAADPVRYFGTAKAWLADRVYPIKQASLLHKKLLFFVLHTPPQRRVTLGQHGFIFLNGPSDQELNTIFETACIRAHSADSARRLERALDAFLRYGQHQTLRVDIVIIPSMATLYGDYLPLSVPEKYRTACAERAQGKSPLLEIQSPAGLTFSFPFAQMKAARNDEAFFPKGNWHASGLSLKVVRDVYTSQLNVATAVDERLELSSAPSEIMRGYGITKKLPFYIIHNANLKSDPERNSALQASIGDLFRVPRFTTHALSNAQPTIDEALLMVSDSYGERASRTFAGAFRSVLQVTTHGLLDDKLAELITRVRGLETVDRLVFLIQEGNLDVLVSWSRVLEASLPRRRHRK